MAPCGAIPVLAFYVLVAIALLLDHNATEIAVVVAVPAVGAVPAVIAVIAELRTGAAPMIAMLDHDSVGTRNRRRHNRNRGKRRDDVTRLLHIFLLHQSALNYG